MSGRQDSGHGNTPSRSFIVKTAGFCTQVFAVADAEVRKLRHDPWELITRAVQPMLWLVLYGKVMAQVRGLAPGSIPYLDFISPGILAQSVLFVAIFYGISAIWERDLGVLHRYMVSPAPRSALVLGKALSSSIRGLSQAAVVYVCASLMGVALHAGFWNISMTLLFIVLGSGLFSTFSLIVASIVRTRERFMGIGQLLTMPTFFASNAIYPIALVPQWLKSISLLNPLTYEVDGLRTVMLRTGQSSFGIGQDFVVLLIAFAVLVACARRMYPRMTE